MKYIIGVMLFFFQLTICFAEVSLKGSPKPSDVDNFFHYSNGMIVLPKFYLEELGIRGSNVDRVFKVPTVKLEKYGLKVGSIIQSTDIEVGRKNPDFILRDYVYAIHAPGRDAYRKLESKRLRMIASYDEKFISEVKALKSSEVYATGVAYLGKGRKLYETKLKKIPTTDVTKINFKINSWHMEKKGAQLRSINVFDNKLYVYLDTSEFSTYEPVLKIGDNYFSLTVNSHILTRDMKYLNIADWGENEKILVLADRFSDEDCSNIYFLKKKTIEYVPLPCETDDLR